MTFSSSLADDLRLLVFDTSVLINLYACSYGERILAALSNAIIVPQVVAEELEHETSRKNGARRFLHGLLARGRVTLGKMTDRESVLFRQSCFWFSILGRRAKPRPSRLQPTANCFPF